MDSPTCPLCETPVPDSIVSGQPTTVFRCGGCNKVLTWRRPKAIASASAITQAKAEGIAPIGNAWKAREPITDPSSAATLIGPMPSAPPATAPFEVPPAPVPTAAHEAASMPPEPAPIAPSARNSSPPSPAVRSLLSPDSAVRSLLSPDAAAPRLLSPASQPEPIPEAAIEVTAAAPPPPGPPGPIQLLQVVPVPVPMRMPPPSNVKWLALGLLVVVGLAAASWAVFGKKDPGKTGGEETTVAAAPPETKAPETKAPETKAPETKAPETKTPEPKSHEPKSHEPKSPEPRTAPAHKPDRDRVVLDYDKGPDASAAVPPEVAADVQKARALYQKGNASLDAKDTTAAIAAYQGALKAYPGYVAGYRGLGLAFTQQKDNVKAVAAFKLYLKKAPTARDAALISKVIEKLDK